MNAQKKIATWFDAFHGVELNQEIIWYEWAREDLCHLSVQLFSGQVTKVYSDKDARVKAFQKCAGGWR